MRIKQDSRRPGGSARLAEYRRMCAVHFEQPDPRQARPCQPRTGLVGGPAYLIWIVGLVACGAYRWYGYEVFKLCPNVSEYRLHRNTTDLRLIGRRWRPELWFS